MTESRSVGETSIDLTAPSDEVVAKANQLYWHSEESVNKVARQLDLSKGMLYEILTPLPAELPCPHCGDETSYANRTARDRAFVSCAACGFEDEARRVRALLDSPPATAPSGETAPSRDPAPHGAAPLRPSPPAPRRLETLVVISALAGLAAGFILGGILRRR